MFFSWISLDLDLRSQVISWSLLVPSCSIIFTYKKLTPPTIASGIATVSMRYLNIYEFEWTHCVNFDGHTLYLLVKDKS